MSDLQMKHSFTKPDYFDQPKEKPKANIAVTFTFLGAAAGVLSGCVSTPNVGNYPPTYTPQASSQASYPDPAIVGSRTYSSVFAYCTRQVRRAVKEYGSAVASAQRTQKGTGRQIDRNIDYLGRQARNGSLGRDVDIVTGALTVLDIFRGGAALARESRIQPPNEAAIFVGCMQAEGNFAPHQPLQHYQK